MLRLGRARDLATTSHHRNDDEHAFDPLAQAVVTVEVRPELPEEDEMPQDVEPELVSDGKKSGDEGEARGDQ